MYLLRKEMETNAFASTNGNKKLLKMYIKLFGMILKIPLKNK